MNYKEHLLHFFLQGKISLSQYDYKFMSNLQQMIHANHRITTNQVELFDKLVSKYRKQLIKTEFNVDTLKSLPWKTSVVQSTEEYTSAKVSLVGNELTIKLPFNKTFISEFRDIKYNTFEWNKDRKVYTAPFSTTALHVAATKLQKYFSVVRFCDTLQAILDQLKQYEDATVWDPTLVKVGNSYFIAACNPIIADVLSDVELNTEPKTLYTLSNAGVKVDPALLTEPKLKFAHEYSTQVDLCDLTSLISWLQELDCKNVILGRGITLNKQVYNELTLKLNEANIYYRSLQGATLTKADVLIQPTSITIDRSFRDLGKIVTLSNSNPVVVK
jgi:hypothetical protein